MRERTRRAACRAARTQTELPDFIAAPRAAGVNSGAVHLVCRSSRRVYDPVTSRSFILRFICANGGQSGVPLAPPRPSPGCVALYFLLCAPLAGCVSPRSVKNPHAPSFQLLNNTKQTLTYFPEQGTSSAEHPERNARRSRTGGGARCRRRPPAIGSHRDSSREGRGFGRQHTW